MCWRLAGLVPAPAPAHAHASSARTSMRQAQHYCHTHTEGWAQRVMPPARQRGGGGRAGGGGVVRTRTIFSRSTCTARRGKSKQVSTSKKGCPAQEGIVCVACLLVRMPPPMRMRARARVCVCVLPARRACLT